MSFAQSPPDHRVNPGYATRPSTLQSATHTSPQQQPPNDDQTVFLPNKTSEQIDQVEKIFGQNKKMLGRIENIFDTVLQQNSRIAEKMIEQTKPMAEFLLAQKKANSTLEKCAANWRRSPSSSRDKWAISLNGLFLERIWSPSFSDSLLSLLLLSLRL